MIEIKEVLAAKTKAEICNNILRALPNWFGVEESIVDYVSGVENKPFYGLFNGDNPVGFVSVLVHNPFTAEIYVMGILEAYHGQGLGKKIVATCEDYCRLHSMEFLTVKTLDASRESAHYARTRKFYESVGFKPLEVFKTLWDEANPCLFMVKTVTL
ncbi:MAG: GNAT family N-acetyltransferase [Defluviitaleaceae bacterium]|nr:GNAT family N-acetyltransferase [Defluviitaleaceae bacterium]